MVRINNQKLYDTFSRKTKLAHRNLLVISYQTQLLMYTHQVIQNDSNFIRKIEIVWMVFQKH
jgi:hypothetical protein